MLITMVLAPLAPGLTLTLAGVAVREKLGAAVTVSCSLVVLLTLAEVPVIVIVDVVAADELPAVSVNVLVVMALAGLNAAVTPAGRPEAVKFTAPLKPF